MSSRSETVHIDELNQSFNHRNLSQIGHWTLPWCSCTTVLKSVPTFLALRDPWLAYRLLVSSRRVQELLVSGSLGGDPLPLFLFILPPLKPQSLDVLNLWCWYNPWVEFPIHQVESMVMPLHLVSVSSLPPCLALEHVDARQVLIWWKSFFCNGRVWLGHRSTQRNKIKLVRETSDRNHPDHQTRCNIDLNTDR